ncbi:MAG: PqqD family protein [Clostridia bacterium]|nr:PqqD family protein [Oscillospiraceae bacterium]MBQ2746195.1 PqqD family protein [Clostridia bacterium]
MKIRDTYILRSVAGENLVVAVGANVNFNSVMTLNETGKFLWEKLTADTTKEALIDALLSEYDVDKETAERDVSAFIEKLKINNILE